jgi:superfamily I DNA/RNA helicase
VLEAVAGSGKTTTLIEALKLMKGQVFFGAYNKKIAEEIAARAPKTPGLFISTMHAAGFRAWRRAAAGVQVNSTKCRGLFRQLNIAQELEAPTLALVSYAKQAAAGVTTQTISEAFWHDTIEHFDVDTLDRDAEVIEAALAVLSRSQETDHIEVDFDDMIYAPLVHRARMFEHDWVLIDEAQDTNAARRALALRLLRRGGRLVAVGDRHQAIYGFTGADADALDLIAQAVSAAPMPLTVTYRCPKAVVRCAHQWVQHIEAHESAPEGRVSSVPATQPLVGLVQPGDAILSRFNAPLLGLVYKFIAAGVPAQIEGREIAVGLKQLARRWRVKSFDKLLDRLETYVEREVAKYRAKEQESRAAAIEDKAECLRVLIDRVQRIDPSPLDVVQRLCDEIDQLFGDTSNGQSAALVLLSTIHKSKGREWEHVFWLQTGPSKWARKAWELEQESNLCYVAATRAKSELFLVGL